MNQERNKKHISSKGKETHKRDVYQSKVTCVNEKRPTETYMNEKTFTEEMHKRDPQKRPM